MIRKIKIEIVTVNRFDGNRNYDYILVIGNLKGKHFDIFHCMSAAEITVLMYEAENMVFRLAERKANPGNIYLTPDKEYRTIPRKTLRKTFPMMTSRKLTGWMTRLPYMRMKSWKASLIP